MTSRSRTLALLVALVLPLAGVSAAAARPAAPSPDPVDAMADVPASTAERAEALSPLHPSRPPRNDADQRDLVVTRVFVTTSVDSDRDGRPDVVRVVVTRPRPGVVGGRRLATVAQVSPYFSCCAGAPNHDVDVPLGQARRPSGAPGRIKDYLLTGIRTDGAAWARKGYAYARVASLGSNGSTGCPTIGDDLEAAGAVALVDWLNGRTTARTASGRLVRARGWSTGNVGMTGASYDGTLPNMAAATGVAGLRAIVPLSAISSWYHYYRQAGLVVAPGGYQGEDADVLARFDYTRRDRRICRPVIADLERDQDRATGDHNDFWAARDLVPRAGDVRAAVLIGHGFNDTNVKPDQAARWYAALRRAGVPAKIWWDQGSHGTPVPQRLVDRWFDHFLYGVRNGVAGGKRAAVSDGGTTRWYRSWPRPGSSPRTWTLRAGGGLAPGGRSSAARRTFTDDASLSAADVCASREREHAAIFRSAVLRRGLDLSGTPRADVRLTFDATAANVTVALCQVDPAGRGSLLTQGFADPQNVGSPTRGTPLVPGRPVDVRVELQPLDRALPPGARIALVVMSSDRDFTLRPPAGTRVTLAAAHSSLRLPVVR
ncbi:CocE/NonD family hydrolase [Nocardioides dongxiaopingii]|uniref:CocE/NonD family hydrolase n=1 Tax=Nocardioides dongxiaopingii TaxID=2576036 RepID=UPI0010C76C9F|nr:CocE/NonD family hydrolase [Nocardioides dongxiaopingii]